LAPIQRVPLAPHDVYISKSLQSCPLLPIQKPPLTLLQVCSWWKSVALAAPNLWTGLCISLSHRILCRDPAIVRQYEELASQWFLRAGPDRKLSLQIDNSIWINIILSSPERFRELKINLRDPHSLATIIRGHGHVSFVFNQLEDLTIDYNQPRMGVSFATWTPQKDEHLNPIWFPAREGELCSLAAVPQIGLLEGSEWGPPVCSVYQSRERHLPSHPQL
jgi:hypothetical protein